MPKCSQKPHCCPFDSRTVCTEQDEALKRSDVWIHLQCVSVCAGWDHMISCYSTESAVSCKHIQWQEHGGIVYHPLNHTHNRFLFTESMKSWWRLQSDPILHCIKLSSCITLQRRYTAYLWKLQHRRAFTQTRHGRPDWTLENKNQILILGKIFLVILFRTDWENNCISHDMIF